MGYRGNIKKNEFTYGKINSGIIDERFYFV